MKAKKDYATELTEKIMNEIKTRFDKDIIFLSFDYDIEKDYSEIETELHKTMSYIIDSISPKIKLSKLNEINIQKTSVEFLNETFSPLFLYASINLVFKSLSLPKKTRELRTRISIRESNFIERVFTEDKKIIINHSQICNHYMAKELHGIMPKTNNGKIKFINIQKKHELLTRIEKNDKGENILRTGSQYPHIAHLLSKERRNSRSIPVLVIYNIGYGNHCIKRYL